MPRKNKKSEKSRGRKKKGLDKGNLKKREGRQRKSSEPGLTLSNPGKINYLKLLRQKKKDLKERNKGPLKEPRNSGHQNKLFLNTTPKKNKNCLRSSPSFIKAMGTQCQQ